MDDLSKLKHLVSHWFEHNEQHAATYEEWAGRMTRTGKTDVAAELSLLAEQTRNMDEVLKRLEGLL